MGRQLRSARVCAVIGAAMALLPLAGCASSGGGGAPGTAGTSPAARGETFIYRPTANRDLRVTVNRMVVKGDKEFLARNPNWLQLHVTVANIGSRTITFRSIQERLADGTLIASASGSDQLNRAPNMGATVAKTTGIGVVGHMAGMFLFPPAALLGAVASSASMAGSVDKVKNRGERFRQLALQSVGVAPGTSVNGFVFLPAVRGQTAIVAFYSTGASEESLVVPRVLEQAQSR